MAFGSHCHWRYRGAIAALVMSHQDKKVKLDSKEEEEVEGGPAEAALAEEHEEHAGQVEEHAEQHEADDALEEGYKEELDGAVAALEEIQERIQGVRVLLCPTYSLVHAMHFLSTSVRL